MSEQDNIQLLQSMVFGTGAGQLLRGLFMEAGHFHVGQECKTEKEMIEQNLVKGFMASCGIGITMVPVKLEAGADEQNVIEKILKEGVPNE